MMTAQQISLANLLLATRVVDEVFHSVTLHADDKGEKYPVYAKGGEEFYIGPNDKRSRFAYIRQTGPVLKGDEVFGKQRNEDVPAISGESNSGF